MLLDDMMTYLSSGNVGTAGTNLFAGFMPDAPDTCTAVYETGGYGPVHGMRATAGGAVMEWARVQVVCRAQTYDYVTARTTAHSAYKLLDGLPTRTINGTQYFWGKAIQTPFTMGRDETGRVLIAFNVDVAKEQTA